VTERDAARVSLIIARLPLVSLHALHDHVGDPVRSTFDASPLNCLIVVPAPMAHFSAPERDDDLVCRNVAVAA
jgi:hypothetical protein